MTILSFLAIGALLTVEGWLAARWILNTREENTLSWLLAYPLGALINTFVFFDINVLHLPFVTVFIEHGIVLVALIATQRMIADDPLSVVTSSVQLPRWIVSVSWILIAVIAITTIIYATLSPLYFWDTFTNWAMRAKMSLAADHFIVEGIRQPQYPILLHSLYIVMMLPYGWNDWLVNMSTLPLSLSGFSALWVLLYRNSGRDLAALTLALLVSLPLVTVHLRQGYADIHLGLYVLLSAVTLQTGLQQSSKRLLLLSGILVCAASWTKFEGLYFGVLPWLCLTILHAWRTASRHVITHIIAPTLALTALWPLNVLSHGLPLSPHGGSVAFHPEAMHLIANALLIFDSFSVAWYAVLCLVPHILWRERSIIRLASRNTPLVWGLLSSVLIVCIYTFTDEFRGLVQGDNFSRAMIAPTMLLIVGLVRTYGENAHQTTSLS